MRLKLILLGLLIAVNMLVYVPAPEDADGVAMLAVAANLVRFGRVDIDQAGAQDWLLLPRGKMGSFGVDGALYAKKGITPTLALMPLVWISDRLSLSTRAVASLLNVFVTAITAVLIYTFACWLGYRERTGIALALIFNLATMSIAYVKTLFGEPLAALLLLIAVMWAWKFRQKPQISSAVIVFAALGLMIGVNPIYLLILGIIGIYLFFGLPRAWFLRIAAAGFVLILIGGGIALYNAVRFGGAAISGYQFAAGEGFTYPLLDGIYGMILSPYRGLFWYNPVLLLSIPAWIMFRRKFSALAWLILALCVAQVLMFATWWSWYGGIVWGPRFLLPALPLLVLILAPLIDFVWGRRWQFVAVGTLIVLSALVQLPGVALSYLPYNGYLIAVFHEPIPKSVISDPLLSPIVGHIALISGGYPLDPAWLGQRGDEQAQMAKELNDALQPPAVTVVASTLFGDNLVDIKSARVISMNAPTTPDDPRAQQVWDYGLHQGDQLWLVTWFPPAATENWQERSLWGKYSFVKEVSATGHRAVLFDLINSPNADTPSEANFADGLHLRRYGVRAATGVGKVYVTLTWATTRLLGQNYSWFVHVLDDAGNIIAQQDRQPIGGYAPTSTWQPGQEFTDRLMLPLPANTTPAALRIGWVDPATGKPLSLAGSQEPFLMISLNR
ncbi:MAG: hypothetical protein KF726_18275 [Anaerolineae bacterium]|nr:hypothetical protein [Anaerolineae bacterium]